MVNTNIYSNLGFWVSVDGQVVSGYSVSTFNLSNGPHTISVGIDDPVMDSVTVDVSNAPLSITGPQNGATISGTVNITTNNLYGSYWVSVDGQRISGHSVDTTTLSNGSHVIAVGVDDPTMSAITVTVDNTVPQPPSDQTNPLIQSWLDNAVGRGMDTDGYFGYQCKDVVNDYLDYLGMHNAIDPGDASQAFYGGYNADKLDKISNTPTNFPQPGAILCFSYNHIGVVLSADVNSFTLIEQNGNLASWTNEAPYGSHVTNMGAPAYTHVYPNYNSVVGWFMPIL
jgi:uncharacterized protein YdeI (BOF family)